MRSERSIGAKAAPLLSLKGIGKLFGAFEALAESISIFTLSKSIVSSAKTALGNPPFAISSSASIAPVLAK